MFITLQRYEILSKSQRLGHHQPNDVGVYHSAKIRNFKQITTMTRFLTKLVEVFITLQRYEILSKSQLLHTSSHGTNGVYHSAKIRNFKQITTNDRVYEQDIMVFITLQRYEILSKSQPLPWTMPTPKGCLSLCKDTKF